MTDRRRGAVIVAAAALPFFVALLLDGHVDPVLLWGGQVCSPRRRLSTRCMVPPYALFLVVVVSMEVADHLLERVED